MQQTWAYGPRLQKIRASEEASQQLRCSCHTANQAIAIQRQYWFKKLLYLSSFLGQRERHDAEDLGLTQEMLAASISTGLSRLLGDLTVAGETCVTSRFSSQYLCGTERQDSSHITLTARVASPAALPGKDGDNRQIIVLLDCVASANFISPVRTSYRQS